MIRLGLRLTLHGGREAAVRLAVTAVAVALGVALLLITLAGVNALQAQNARYAWLNTNSSSGSTSAAGASHDTAAPLWWLFSLDQFGNQAIDRVDVAATGTTSPVPPGISHLPGPGQFYASPALSKLLSSNPTDELANRFSGQQIGTIGPTALPAPNALIVVVGHTPDQLSHVAGAEKVTSIQTGLSSCYRCSSGGGSGPSLEWILAAAALALLFPILVLIATATRLSTARREQRFAAIRLVGATPRQVSVISAVESIVAAVAGVAIGFGLFFVARPALVHLPFTGAPFAPGDLSLKVVDVLVVAIGIPLAAAVSARVALRRVRISPLGVTRRTSSAAPRAIRLIPLLAGIAELAYFAGFGKPKSNGAQIEALALGFLLLLSGLLLAGPWLTSVGARVMARRTSRPAVLVAGRRLSDDPRAAFRAIGGLVLALFITTLAVGSIGTVVAAQGAPAGGTVATDTLVDSFCGVTMACQSGTVLPPVPMATVNELRSIRGAEGVAVVHEDPSATHTPKGEFPTSAGLVQCSQLAATPAVGRCASGAEVAKIGYILSQGGASGGPVADQIWPAATIAPGALQGLPVEAIVVATNGSASSIERVRTAFEVAFPFQGPPTAVNEITPQVARIYTELGDMTDLVIIASLIIAACSLAVSAAAGMSDRKRPFSLLRLTGVRVAVLRRVVAIEAAVPLVAVSLVAIGTGLIASDLYLKSEVAISLRPPGLEYYLVVFAGFVAALVVVAATLPLIDRMTGPEIARNE